jgi:hypothetical protein
VEMPYRRHTIPHSKEVLVGFDQKLFDKVWKDRWNPYEDRPIRDVSEMFHVARRVVNSDESRLAALKAIMQSHPRLIIFYNFDYELSLLRTLSDTRSTESFTIPGKSPSFSVAEWNGHKHQQVPTTSTKNDSRLSELESGPPNLRKTSSISSPRELSRVVRTAVDLGNRSISNKIDPPEEALATPAMTDNLTIAEWNGHKHQQIPTTERWIYLVQYAAGGEGWNCIKTNSMAFYSLPYSYKQFHQAHGRIDRLNTPFVDLYYYTLMSFSLMDLAISRCLAAKKSFNESKYLRKT